MKIANFLSWCSAQGISSPLHILERNDGSRYAALKHDHVIPESDKLQLISCPPGAVLTGFDRAELADRLLFERNLGKKSAFCPHMEVLPTLESFQDMPRFWKPSRFDAVTDGGLLLDAAQEESDGGGADPWALACADTRANYLPDMSYAITPLLDMVNHDASVKTSAQVVEDGVFELNVAADSIVTELQQQPESGGLFGMFQQQQQSTPPPPPEVCISYGDLDNLQTLLQYGFVSPDNPCSEETFEICILRQPAVRATILRDTYKIDPLSLGTLRRILATTDELELIEEGSMVGFLSDRNEVEVYAVMAGFLQEAISYAETGAAAATASDDGDNLVATYLSGRANTLQRGLDRIARKYPDLLG